MMRMHEKVGRLTRCGALLGLLTFAAGSDAATTTNAPDERLAAFQKVLESVQRDAATASPDSMARLLTLGAEVGRPQAAAAVAKNFLAQRRDVPPALFLQAAETAEMAGDLRSAVARYKQYLEAAPAGADVSDVTLRLYHLLCDSMGASDDAYRLMTAMNGASRATTALKQYDAWYLDQARRRKDVVAHARRLAAVMGDAMPLEMERPAYWEHLEWLMRELTSARPEQFAALPDCKRIAGLIRENDKWSKRFAFVTANLAFESGVAGKDAATVEREFEPVLAAATAYVDAAPTADTVREIARTFGGGPDRYDDARYMRQFKRKAALFAHAFEVMSDKERDELFNPAWLWDPQAWAGRLVTRELGGQLIAAHADFFRKTPNAWRMPLVTDSTNVAAYKALAPFTRGIGSPDALAVTALGSHDDLVACWQRVLQDSWSVPAFTDVTRANDIVWNAFSRFPRAEADKLPDNAADRALAKFGSETLNKTPLFLFDQDLAKRYLMAAWRYGNADADVKSDFAQVLNQLGWIPYTERERQTLLGDVNRAFRGWADGIRNRQREAKQPVDATGKTLDGLRKQREDEAKKPNANLQAIDAKIAEQIRTLDAQKAALAKVDALAATITPLEEAFKQAMGSNAGDPNKAPNDLCKQLARATIAVREKNASAFMDAARAAYPAVRSTTAQKTPFGRAALVYLVRNRFDAFDTIDFQSEVVADQVSLGTPEAGNKVLVEVYGLINDGRGWLYQSNEKAKRLTLNKALAKAMRELLARGQYSPTVFEWFVATRRAQGWTELGGDLDIMESLITRTNLVLGTGSRTTMLMSWIRNDFPKLAQKYPLESWFDDSFAAECRQTQWLDRGYYDNGGRDEKAKVAQALADVLQNYERLPFGYSGGKIVYPDRERFWDMHARAMSAAPAVRDAMLTKIESCFGKTRYDYYANGAARVGTRALSSPAERKAFFDGLRAWVAARQKEPVKATQASLAPLSALSGPADLTDDELNVLIALLRLEPGWNWSAMGDLDRMVHEGLLAKKRANELFALAPRLWGLARSQPTGDSIRNRMVGYANALSDAGMSDLAGTYAAAGLEVLGPSLKDDQRSALMAVKAKALSKVLAVVSVDRADRRFPLFQAQADYQIGKFEEAWQAYLKNKGLFGDTFRELDPTFSIWLIGKLTDVGNYTDAEGMSRIMIQWVDQSPQSFDPEDRARLLLAYAQISFARQEYPRARAIYEQVVAAKEFEDTLSRRDADLKIVEIDRLTKHYDKAIERLENMLRSRDAYVQAEANYGLALVKFDQEEYVESRAFVDKVLAIAPAHANARILEGKLYLKLKKLVEATEVRVGLAASQKTIIPGKPLKVSLEDRNLGVVGQSASIEIRAWTDSGDEETFGLLPFGDSKTKFEGQIPTALARIRKADKTLQVLGGDVVHYDFSEAFKRANKITGQEPVSIRVISDGELYASSGKILSKEEQEQRQLEAMIRARMQAEAKAETGVALSTIRSDDEVKPGNPVNVRVIDPDASVTTNKDKVRISVSTSSGDRIGNVVLQETDPYSGIFEGQVPTASALATAFALDSEEGKEPNFAISGADYPAWSGRPDNVRPKWFSVDLNNSFTLGKMKVLSDVPGRKLKKLILQVSPNGEDFTSVCAWPTNLRGWSGAGRLEVVRYADATKAPASLREFKDYLEVGYAAAGCEKAIVSPPPLEFRWDKSVNDLADRLGLAFDGPNSWYIGHVQVSFYQPVRQKRTFRLMPQDPRKGVKTGPQIVTLDGEAGLTAGEVSKSLAKGMHRLDVYFASARQRGTTLWLETDSADHTEFVRCKPDMFAAPSGVDSNELDSATSAIAFQPAAITNSPDNGSFEVTFPSNTTARMLRLWLMDFETDAPAIRKVYLSGADGKAILPTAQDVVKLKENDRLEIVPGDRITLTYEDPSFLSKERQFAEAFMQVTFHNATLSACFIESVVDDSGNRQARYIPMRRFKPGDTVNVFIEDSDCDASDARDIIKFRAQAGQKGPTVTVEALETDTHSGIFLGKVFPVKGVPQRPSEIQLSPNDDLTLNYLDAENTDPGIPWERTFALEQTSHSVPQLRLYSYISRLLSEMDKADRKRVPDNTKKLEEVVPVTRSIRAVRSESGTNAQATVLLGCPLIAEVTHPEIAQSPLSRASLYVQTSAGRKKYGREPEGIFDIHVPGTVRVDVPASDRPSIMPPPGYRDVAVMGAGEGDALDDGRFTFVVPLRLGAVPEQSMAEVKPEEALNAMRSEDFGEESDWSQVSMGGTSVVVPVLRVRGDDQLFLGYTYQDAAGSSRWMTASASLSCDPFLDVMDRRYQEPVTNLHVGESFYVRVINPVLDRSDAKDTVSVQVKGSSGQPQTLSLSETFGHSGVFKGMAQVMFSGDPTVSNAPGIVRANYGDMISTAYLPPASTQSLERLLEVFKGDDGVVLPFTKRFKDPAIAVQTQFTVAEAYFEMAKKHRELGQEEVARREIGQGKKLLEEAIRDYPNTDARAQAEYLLADLALESGAQVPDADQKAKYHMEAVNRFTDIVASYPDSPYAPKAQFKKALTYEKMGKIDEACEEYVKLSYRYPDNELVAETIARLGQYFLSKGKGIQDKMAAETDVVARERIHMEAVEMYKTAAQVFGRLAVRFPDHKLSSKASVLSGQCYMRAEDYERSVNVFMNVIDAKKAEPELLAEAMYWCGDCHMRSKNKDSLTKAYQMFKTLTWDYPESTWAKYARGRLSEEALAKIEKETSN